MNGKVGTCKSFDPARQRWLVELDGAADNSVALGIKRYVTFAPTFELRHVFGIDVFCVFSLWRVCHCHGIGYWNANDGWR